MRTSLVVGCAVTAALVLGGCRENERGRPLSFEPGVYKRDKLPALTDTETKVLRERGALMR
jgi:hypothetical protein